MYGRANGSPNRRYMISDCTKFASELNNDPVFGAIGIDAATRLPAKVGISVGDLDEGCIPLANAKAFVESLGKLRAWGREPGVKLP
jgi:hypothetical protein